MIYSFNYKCSKSENRSWKMYYLTILPLNLYHMKGSLNLWRPQRIVPALVCCSFIVLQKKHDSWVYFKGYSNYFFYNTIVENMKIMFYVPDWPTNNYTYTYPMENNKKKKRKEIKVIISPPLLSMNISLTTQYI